MTNPFDPATSGYPRDMVGYGRNPPDPRWPGGAVLAVQIPFIEVHISNIYARESFRQHSCFSDIATGVISGLGTHGYLLALQAIIDKLT